MFEKIVKLLRKIKSKDSLERIYWFVERELMHECFNPRDGAGEHHHDKQRIAQKHEAVKQQRRLHA